MTTYGVTSKGFVVPAMLDIKAGIDADLKAAFGNDIDLSDSSNFSKFSGLMADRLSSLWEVALALNASRSPSQASGAALIDLCAVTGTTPKLATYSSVTAILTGDNGTDVLAGQKAATASAGSVFSSTADATLATVATRASSTAYALGDLVSNDGSVWVCTFAGTTYGDTTQAPTGTVGIRVDGGVTWTWAGLGLAAVTTTFQADESGAVVAPAGTLTTIQTPVVGWSGVYNVSDATTGSPAETDPELRVRRDDELVGESDSTPHAIRVRILQDLEAAGDAAPTVIVIFNNTDTTDANGLPPHSVECLVKTTVDDQTVTDSVFAHVAAGIGYYGGGSGAVTGSYVDTENGITYTVKWSKPSEIPIYVIVNANVDAETFPSDGADQITAAIIAFAANFTPGLDVVSRRLGAQAFSVKGVLDTPSVYIGTSPSPASETTLTMGLRDLATFDSSNITVNTTPVTP